MISANQRTQGNKGRKGISLESSPKRIEIQALGYILGPTKFKYSLAVIAARTNKHFISGIAIMLEIRTG